MIRQLSTRNRSTPNRRGVSILEVLFAIMISSIGLMGAIAVFPAALLQTKRGQQADMTAAAGLSGIATFDAMGMRKAARWLNSNGGVVAPPDGSYAYCIDPRFMAANATDNNANRFPYASGSRMIRVTLDNGAATATPTPMQRLQANLIFGIDDDLAYDRFTGTFNGIDQSTQQAASLFARNSSGAALKRESHGHMSWMATLSPKIDRLQQPANSVEDRYVLSVVVFYDRPTELQANAGFEASEWELTVPAASMYGGGIGGGDMQLSVDNSLPAEEQLRRLTIHRDQWIMLSGNLPAVGTNGRPIAICRWYRVIDSDEPNANVVDVTLAGADWEVPAAQTRAVVAKGVVAVFEKTIKLEPRN